MRNSLQLAGMAGFSVPADTQVLVAAAEKVGELISVHVIARPHTEVDAILPKSGKTGSAPKA